MTVLVNSWIEKIRKRKTHETAPAYESDHLAESEIYNTKRPATRSTVAARSILLRTLRGVRK